jgi:hypothetical protein
MKESPASTLRGLDFRGNFWTESFWPMEVRLNGVEAASNNPTAETRLK